MKNRIIGVFLLLSILLVFLILVPLKRELYITVDKSLMKNLIKLNLIIYNKNGFLLEKDYFFDEKFTKYFNTIQDEIRLKTGVYNVDVYLIYPENYLTKNVIFEVSYNPFQKSYIHIKD